MSDKYKYNWTDWQIQLNWQIQIPKWMKIRVSWVGQSTREWGNSSRQSKQISEEKQLEIWRRFPSFLHSPYWHLVQTFSKQPSLSLSWLPRKRRMRQQQQQRPEQTNLERETTRDSEEFSILSLLTNTSNSGRVLFAGFNVRFNAREHYRNWSINRLPLTGALWIANSCRFHVESLDWD